jgi:hypothetical protein
MPALAGRGAGADTDADAFEAVVRVTVLLAATDPTSDGIADGILTPDEVDETRRGLADAERTDWVVAAAGEGVLTEDVDLVLAGTVAGVGADGRLPLDTGVAFLIPGAGRAGI